MDRRDAHVIRLHRASRRADGILLLRMVVRIRDEHDALRTVLTRVDRLVDECRVRREVRAIEATVGIQLLRFVPERDDDLVRHVDAAVVVVAQFGSRYPIADERHRCFERRRV